MRSLRALAALNVAFADLAAQVDTEAAVKSSLWPTAGEMVDHLGGVQAWATEIVRTGSARDRKAFVRPVDRDAVEWFSQTSEALVTALEATDPHRDCWVPFGAAPAAGFWRRRMTIEAAKHLWDLRTAVDASPRMPAELDLEQQADVVDEFAEVLVPAARARGIEPLPHDLLLIADDIDRGWRISPEWQVTSAVRTEGDADLVRADVGDLGLFVWERADPWALTDRFRVEGEGRALRGFARTPVHV